METLLQKAQRLGIQPIKKQEQNNENPVVGFAKGVGKGALSTLNSMAELGQKTIGAVGTKIANEITGANVPTPDASLPTSLTEASTPAQKVGKGVEQVAEFFTPVGLETKIAANVGKVGKMAKFMDKATPVIQDAIKTGTISGIHEGDLKDAGFQAVLALGLGGVGKIAGVASGVTKEWLSTKLPGRILNSIIKPSGKEFSFGKNPGQAVVNEGITGKSLEDLFSKISEKKTEIGKAIDSEMGKINKGVKIDITPAIAKIDEFISTATNQGEQALVTRLQDIKNGLTKTFKNENGKLITTGDKPLVVNPMEAWKIKQMVGNASKWTGQAFDGEANQARVAVYSVIRDMIEKVAPTTKKLNARYANILTAEKAAERRVAAVERLNQLGIGDKLVGISSGLYSYSQSGDPLSAIAVATGTAGLSKAARSPFVQTRIAKFLSGLNPNDRSIIEGALPAIQKIILGLNEK